MSKCRYWLPLEHGKVATISELLALDIRHVVTA